MENLNDEIKMIESFMSIKDRVNFDVANCKKIFYNVPTSHEIKNYTNDKYCLYSYKELEEEFELVDSELKYMSMLGIKPNLSSKTWV